MECRRRLRRTRAVQRGASAAADTQEGYERGEWPQLVGGDAHLKASAEAPASVEESVNNEGARPLVAEVDHFRSLRAR
jgi:hypothetical protein